MRFSIIIPLRKINTYVREAMPYYKKQIYKNFEIIIVSETREKEKFPNTRIIKVAQVSPAEKRNIGTKNAKGEILAFIDDDAYPEKDWLKNANEDFKNRDIVAVGGPGIVPKNATFFQRVSSKVYEFSAGKTGIRYGKGKRKEIDDWPTCNFFVKKSYFKRVRGFDSKYWGGEDTQLCYSLLKTGKKIIYDPKIVVYHHPRKTLKQHLKQTFFWGMWRGFFMKIHKQSRQLTFFIPVIFLSWLILGGTFSFFNIIIKKIFIVSMLFYLVYLIILGLKTKSVKLFIPVMFGTFLTHISYGLGFLRGIFSGKGGPTRKTLNPAEISKIS